MYHLLFFLSVGKGFKGLDFKNYLTTSTAVF